MKKYVIYLANLINMMDGISVYSSNITKAHTLLFSTKVSCHKKTMGLDVRKPDVVVCRQQKALTRLRMCAE